MKTYQAPWSKLLIVNSSSMVLLPIEKRTVVVSPGEPEDFVAELNLGNPNAATGDRRYR